MADPRYERILLKMGGEALSGPDGFGIDPKRAATVASVVKDVYDLGIQVAVVIGAGNLWRGSIGLSQGMERSTADHMGMIATVMNALALARCSGTGGHCHPGTNGHRDANRG